MLLYVFYSTPGHPLGFLVSLNHVFPRWTYLALESHDFGFELSRCCLEQFKRGFVNYSNKWHVLPSSAFINMLHFKYVCNRFFNLSLSLCLSLFFVL